MQKYLMLSVLLLMILTGCSKAGSELELTEVGEVSEVDSGEGKPDITEAETEEIKEEPLDETVKDQVLFVYVCGAVNAPGVYELTDGSRIDDAVKAAGGFRSDADETYVNLAAKLTDGLKLQIPTTEETAMNKQEGGCQSFDSEGTSDMAGNVHDNGLININDASAEQLKAIPGIGESTASKIIKYREDNGRFASIEDIMKVSGIKEKLFSRIKDYITV